MPVDRAYHRFRVDDYQRMIGCGILKEDDRVELIRGEVLDKQPVGIGHAACVNRLNRLLNRLCGDAAIVSVQNPVRLADSVPEPDIALLRPRDDFYEAAAPRLGDVLLLIEVADSTLEVDRQVKLPLYAENGIAEYWIVNLNEHCVEVYRDPEERGAYRDARVLTGNAAVAPLALPECRVVVSQVLGGVSMGPCGFGGRRLPAGAG